MTTVGQQNVYPTSFNNWARKTVSSVSHGQGYAVGQGKGGE